MVDTSFDNLRPRLLVFVTLLISFCLISTSVNAQYGSGFSSNVNVNDGVKTTKINHGLDQFEIIESDKDGIKIKQTQAYSADDIEQLQKDHPGLYMHASSFPTEVAGARIDFIILATKESQAMNAEQLEKEDPGAFVIYKKYNSINTDTSFALLERMTKLHSQPRGMGKYETVEKDIKGIKVIYSQAYGAYNITKLQKKHPNLYMHVSSFPTETEGGKVEFIIEVIKERQALHAKQLEKEYPEAYAIYKKHNIVPKGAWLPPRTPTPTFRPAPRIMQWTPGTPGTVIEGDQKNKQHQPAPRIMQWTPGTGR